jgi:hypothetical protein
MLNLVLINVSIKFICLITSSFLSIVYMDKMCGNDSIILDGDSKPGVWFQLTSSSKYQANSNCSIKFRAAHQSQRLVITVEKMNIADCPSDSLRIYDGLTLLNKNAQQQCGTNSLFTFTV